MEAVALCFTVLLKKTTSRTKAKKLEMDVKGNLTEMNLEMNDGHDKERNTAE